MRNPGMWRAHCNLLKNQAVSGFRPFKLTLAQGQLHTPIILKKNKLFNDLCFGCSGKAKLSQYDMKCFAGSIYRSVHLWDRAAQVCLESSKRTASNKTECSEMNGHGKSANKMNGIEHQCSIISSEENFDLGNIKHWKQKKMVKHQIKKNTKFIRVTLVWERHISWFPWLRTEPTA